MLLQDRILGILEERRHTDTSGKEIAAALGVSTSAVWKNIKSLQDDGYSIVAVPNRGYRLMDLPDNFKADEVFKHLDTAYLGRKLDFFKSIDSTSTFAKSLAQLEAVDGTTVVAETQTAGRGRSEKSFFSPPKGGIYFSVVIRKSLPIEVASLITPAAAVAVCRAMLEILPSLNPQIKWVNDVFLGGKKVCGILTETSLSSVTGRIEYAVLGIGVNVNNARFPEEVSDVATSIFLQANVRLGRSRLLAAILNPLEPLLENLQGREFMKEYRDRSMVIGRRIKVISVGAEPYSALATDISEDGFLLLTKNDGSNITLSTGSILLEEQG